MATRAFTTLGCALICGLFGCSGDLIVGEPNAYETLKCGYYQAAAGHVPEGWPCWVVDPGKCIITSQQADACALPDATDELFAPGDATQTWCPLGVNEAGERKFHAVQCATGERIN